jgi:hypothetical protein
MKTNEFLLSGGNSHSLEMAMNRQENGIWDPSLVHKLCLDDNLGKIRSLILGKARIIPFQFYIDDSKDVLLTPLHPHLKILEHRPRGDLMKWDKLAQAKALYQVKEQGLLWEQIWQKLIQLPILNQNHLKALLENQDQIPEEWRGTMIWFAGTVYAAEGERKCLDGMFWNSDRGFWESPGGIVADRGWDDKLTNWCNPRYAFALAAS